MKETKVGLNLGPKTSAELATVGIKTLSKLRKIGWKNALLLLITKYPHRLNLNMAAGLIGAELGVHWQKIPERTRDQAKQLIKRLRPKKPKSGVSKKNLHTEFVDYVVNDQLESLELAAKRMFGGIGLYRKGQFFGIIWQDEVFFKTNELSRAKYIAAGMGPFRPSPRQTLYSYYQVPMEVVDDQEELENWAREAASLAK